MQMRWLTLGTAIAVASFGSSAASARFLQVDPIGYKDHVNLYAYVNNDPIDNRDPTGTECINGPNRTTTCITKDYDVTIPTPNGFQNTHPKAPDYHQYSVPNQSPQNAQATREWVRNNPTPGNPAPATPGGTYNDATPVIGSPKTSISPVMSYTTVNKVTGNNVVVNATLPGHPLGNGVVIRDTIPGPKGTSTIMNYGEGNGALQAPGSRVAGEINNTWASPSMRPPNPNPGPQYDVCAAHPGAC
jgi:hypothetical protein